MNLVTPKGAAKCEHLFNKPAYGLSTLRFQMWFDADVLDVQIELQCRYVGIFWLGYCFGYFPKYWALFSIFWSLCFL
jgi:hypothetical protein